MNSQVVRDLTMAVARIILGVIFVVHGVDRFFGLGLDATEALFTASGMPQPHLAVVLVGALELGGGLLLVIGLLTPIAASSLLLLTLWVGWFLHASEGLLMRTGGLELPLALAVGLLLVAVFGGGRYSLDGYLAVDGAAD